MTLSADVVPVLAVVEQADAVAAFAQIDPLLRAGLEARPVPTGVAVRRPLDVAPLDLVGGGGREDIHREGDLEQDVALAPVDGRVEVQARGLPAASEMRWVYALCRMRRLISSVAAQRPGLDHSDGLAGSASHILSS